MDGHEDAVGGQPVPVGPLGRHGQPDDLRDCLDAAQDSADRPPKMAMRVDASGYYPEHQSPLRSQLLIVDKRFAELREGWLLDLENDRTAMAYWGDLERFHDWCLEHNQGILDAEPTTIQAFLEEQLVDGYSPNTVARRLTAFRGFYSYLTQHQVVDRDPTLALGAVPRRLSREVIMHRKRAARARITARRMRNREFQALANRLNAQGVETQAQVQLLLRADGLNAAQVQRLLAAEPEWSLHDGTLTVSVAEHKTVVDVRLRLPDSVAKILRAHWGLRNS